MRRLLLLILVLLCAAPAAHADEVPIPNAPGQWATDTAGFVTPKTLDVSNRFLAAFERSTGNQVLVWIGTTTGDTPLEDWTVKAFEKWRVGRKGLDNGIVLFVFATDRRVRLEVGYGLEGQVPDALASRIINDGVIPRLKVGDPDGAVLTGVDAIRAALEGNTNDLNAILAAASGNAGAPSATGTSPDGLTAGADETTGRGSRQERREVGLGQMIILGLLGIGFLILLITNPRLAILILLQVMSSGGGGRGGGGGGFSGGGGRSGGGGASGSW